MDSAIGVAVAVAVLDLSKYAEHRIFHRFRCLWRIHLVHHADTDLDITTAERHHPLEILLTYPIMLALVAFLALPPEGVAFYAVLSSVVTIWSHADVRWPEQLQTILRVIFVTPDMHEVHHSANRTETDSNYGVVFSIWDRTLGTYVAPTQERSVQRIIGLEYLRDPRDHRLLRTLALPFVRDPCTQQHEKPLSEPAE
jgi:sterol desaturase/sphingolipid hydroxylase (fatty acid hydroxylase superfamily)